MLSSCIRKWFSIRKNLRLYIGKRCAYLMGTNGLVVECGKEVGKFWETDESIVGFGLFMRFIVKSKTRLSFDQRDVCLVYNSFRQIDKQIGRLCEKPHADSSCSVPLYYIFPLLPISSSYPSLQPSVFSLFHPPPRFPPHNPPSSSFPSDILQ